MIQFFSKSTMPFLLSKGKQELLRLLKVQALWETATIQHFTQFLEDKKTSKLTIVFNASAKENGPSLNEVLYKGPQLRPLIFDILIRFRTYAIALTSDIERAFHQVSVY